MHPPLLPVDSSANTSSLPTIDVKLHTRYWQRCLKSLLPTEYQSTDSSRVMLAFLILAALDLLGSGASTMPASEKEILRDWILSCQHPNGGFCGSPNHKYPDGHYGSGRDIDPANLAASFFAILSLAFVGGLERVNRAKTLNWLRTLQREDGSFGELIEGSGRVGGGRDMRYCHFASGIRRILKGYERPKPGNEEYEDIDVEALVAHIRAGETYDGGVAESSEHEAHAGYTYCAIASLSFLDRLPQLLPEAQNNIRSRASGLQNLSATMKWLTSRQILDEDDDEEEESRDSKADPVTHNVKGVGSNEPPALTHLSLEDPEHVGCNGRCNKRADTCYCFWVGASLMILEKDRLVNKAGFRNFLLERTQHRIGGFGKCPGFPPDLYHSYLGLAVLSLMGEPGLKPVDPVFCISLEAKKDLEASIEAVSAEKKIVWRKGVLAVLNKSDPDYESVVKEDEGPPVWQKEVMQKSVLKEATAAAK